MTRAIFKSAWSLQTATMPPGKWQDEHRPLVDERGNVIGIVSAKVLAHGHQCGGGAGGERGVAGECELRGEEQFALELPGIGAGGGGETQSAEHG